MLVFVAGIESSTQCGSQSGSWWGGLLSPINCAGLSVPGQKLVLSPHVYGPDVYDQPYFSHSNFPDNLPPIWEEQWGFAASQGYTVVPGEFGGRYGHGGEPTDRAWQNKVVDYMISKGIKSSFYWSWNPNSGDTGGILQDDWHSVWTDKVELLERLWAADVPDQGSDPDEDTGGDAGHGGNTGGDGGENDGENDGGVSPDSSLQAPRFATKTTGGADNDGGWNVWSNGYIENGFAWSGADQVSVELRGAFANGWPEMKLYAGNHLVETRTISSSDWQTYRFDVQGVTGNQPLRIEFTNDYYQNGQDRNLHVRRVTVTSASSLGTGSPPPDSDDTAAPDTPEEAGPNRVSLRAEHSGQCLSVAESSTAAGANLTQADCSYGTNQQFDVVAADDGSVALRPSHSAQALALAQGSTQNGANILQADWSGADSQLWSLREDAGGVATLRAKNAPGSCLGVSRFSQASGANVHLWRCYGGANQKWRLLPQ